MPNQTASTFRQSKSSFFRVIAITVVALREKIAAAIERRRVRNTLGRLDDYLLKDMGISRSDIERVSNRTLAAALVNSVCVSRSIYSIPSPDRHLPF